MDNHREEFSHPSQPAPSSTTRYARTGRGAGTSHQLTSATPTPWHWIHTELHPNALQNQHLRLQRPQELEGTRPVCRCIGRYRRCERPGHHRAPYAGAASYRTRACDYRRCRNCWRRRQCGDLPADVGDFDAWAPAVHRMPPQWPPQYARTSATGDVGIGGGTSAVTMPWTMSQISAPGNGPYSERRSSTLDNLFLFHPPQTQIPEEGQPRSDVAPAVHRMPPQWPPQYALTSSTGDIGIGGGTSAVTMPWTMSQISTPGNGPYSERHSSTLDNLSLFRPSQTQIPEEGQARLDVAPVSVSLNACACTSQDGSLGIGGGPNAVQLPRPMSEMSALENWPHFEWRPSILENPLLFRPPTTQIPEEGQARADVPPVSVSLNACASTVQSGSCVSSGIPHINHPVPRPTTGEAVPSTTGGLGIGGGPNAVQLPRPMSEMSALGNWPYFESRPSTLENPLLCRPPRTQILEEGQARADAAPISVTLETCASTAESGSCASSGVPHIYHPMPRPTTGDAVRSTIRGVEIGGDTSAVQIPRTMPEISASRNWPYIELRPCTIENLHLSPPLKPQKPEKVQAHGDAAPDLATPNACAPTAQAERCVSSGALHTTDPVCTLITGSSVSEEDSNNVPRISDAEPPLATADTVTEDDSNNVPHISNAVPPLTAADAVSEDSNDVPDISDAVSSPATGDTVCEADSTDVPHFYDTVPPPTKEEAVPEEDFGNDPRMSAVPSPPTTGEAVPEEDFSNDPSISAVPTRPTTGEAPPEEDVGDIPLTSRAISPPTTGEAVPAGGSGVVINLHEAATAAATAAAAVDASTLPSRGAVRRSPRLLSTGAATQCAGSRKSPRNTKK